MCLLREPLSRSAVEEVFVWARVVQAYLAGDEAVLKQHCSPACLQRLLGIMQAERAAEVGELLQSAALVISMVSDITVYGGHK